MPLRLIQMRFGELKVGSKFLGRIPGKAKRVKLIKVWDTQAKLEDRSSTMWYEFKPGTMVHVWRWSY